MKIDNDANGSDDEVNPNAPMRLREKIKEPAKFTPSGVREKRKVGNTRLHNALDPHWLLYMQFDVIRFMLTL